MTSTREHLQAEAEVAERYDSLPRAEKCLKVGPYIITDVIGVGSFSKVRMCVHQQTMARYACKIIEKSLIRNRMSNVQVQREIAIMSRLRHPNTVSLVSVYSTATKVFIIMELVSGCELFDEMKRRKRFSEPFARFYFRQLIRGLHYCHSHGIFHRDLKLNNILLTPDLTIKITDFGLATLKVGAATDGAESVMGSLNLHTQCGTPDYVAPEIIKVDPNGYSGAKVDIWACGILLYVLVAGFLPFEAETTEELFKAIVRCDVSFPPHFSESLKDLINNLLNTNPADRFSTAEVQQHPWFNGPTDCTLEGFPQKIPTIPITIGLPLQRVPLEPSPIYPLPDESKHRHRNDPQKAGDASSELSKNGPSKGSKDSLDFGTRVDSVGSDIALLALSNGIKMQARAVQDISSGGTADHNFSTNGDVDQLEQIPTDSEGGFASKEVNRRNGSHHSMSSDFGPDEGWVLTDTDRVVWCRLMKDFDMVPDILEFDSNSATLSEKWAKGLAKENLRKNSFAMGRFGVLQNARSRSPQFISSAAAATCSTATTRPDHTEAPEKQNTTISMADASGSVTRSVVSGGEVTTSQIEQNGNASSGLNHQRTTGLVPVVSHQVNGTLEEQERDADYELPQPAVIPSTSFSDNGEEQISMEKAGSSGVELSNVYPEEMGGGQDLLDDSNAGLDSVESAGPAPSNHDVDVSGSNRLESRRIANVVGHARNRASTVTSSLSNASHDSRGTSSPPVRREKETGVVSPFAIDLPGPRRALPATKTLLGSIVSSTVSPKRLLRRNATPFYIKSYTQFHSLLEPSSCFDAIQSVLRTHGCSIIKSSSTRSRQKFRIRCELKKDDATVNARVSIYKVDDVLCTVHFKRLPHTEAKQFTRFYSDVSRLYSEYLKQRGLSTEDSTKRQRRSKQVARVRFENQNGSDTAAAVTV